MLEPYELHKQIAKGQSGPDKVTLTVLIEQIGSISKIIDRLSQGEGLGYRAEIEAELADLVFHTEKLARRWGFDLCGLQSYGRERWEDRHPQTSEEVLPGETKE